MMIEEGIGIKLYVDQNALWLYDMGFIDLLVGLGDSECIRHLCSDVCVRSVLMVAGADWGMAC